MQREKRFRELLKHAWDKSPLYREIYSDAGILENDLNEIQLEELPIVSKEDLMVRFDEAVTDQRLKLEKIKSWYKENTNPIGLYLEKYLIIGSTGGSKIVSWVPYTLNSWRLFTTSAAPDLIPEQLKSDQPIRSAFYFTSGNNSASGTNALLASRSAHDVLRVFLEDPVEEVCAKLNSFKPERITGYGSSIGWLVNWSQQGDLDINPNSVVISGDFLSLQAREFIEKAWSAEIYDLYASAESIYMGLKKPGNNHYDVYTDLNIIEILNQNHKMVKNGERGRVFMTSLIHETLPFIRYDMLDYAKLGESNESVATILSLDGKSFDELQVPTLDGGSISIPPYKLSDIDLPKLKKIQYTIHDPENIEIQYIADDNIDNDISSYFKSLIGENYNAFKRVEINKVSHIANRGGSKSLNVVRPEDHIVVYNSFSDAPPECNQTKIPDAYKNDLIFSKDSLTETINARFKRIFSRYSDREAVIGKESIFTYKRLEKKSNIVAGILVEREFDRKRPVAVICDHQPEVIVMIIGVLKAGGFFVPIDTNLTTSRIKRIISDIQPEIILSNCGIDYEEIGISDCEIIYADEFHGKDDQDLDIKVPHISNEDPACLIYTSGTTGTPNGVVLSHKTILHRTKRYSTDYHLSPQDRISFLQSFSFNAGIRDIFGALLNGAPLVFFSIQTQGISSLPVWINENKITILYTIPTVWRLLNSINFEDNFLTVRVIRLGGEPVLINDFNHLKEKFDSRSFFINAYASTETGTICQHIMDHSSQFVADRVPVGTPVDGVDLKIVDDENNPVMKAVGEIIVSGNNLACGYWNPSNKSIVPFDDHFFPTGDIGYQIHDGKIFLLGRIGRIIKIHGIRINLEEIEISVKEIEGILDVIIVKDFENHEVTSLGLYYVEKVGRNISKQEIEAKVQFILPKSVVKININKIPSIPRLPGGKIIEDSLLKFPETLTESLLKIDEPKVYEDEISSTLANIWKEYLGVSHITLQDNFFDLGGDSVIYYRIQIQLIKNFGIEISVREFVNGASFGKMAEIIRKKIHGTSN